jgi:hypothetical protein
MLNLVAFSRYLYFKNEPKNVAKIAPKNVQKINKPSNDITPDSYKFWINFSI